MNNYINNLASRVQSSTSVIHSQLASNFIFGHEDNSSSTPGTVLTNQNPFGAELKAKASNEIAFGRLNYETNLPKLKQDNIFSESCDQEVDLNNNKMTDQNFQNLNMDVKVRLPLVFENKSKIAHELIENPDQMNQNINKDIKILKPEAFQNQSVVSPELIENHDECYQNIIDLKSRELAQMNFERHSMKIDSLHDLQKIIETSDFENTVVDPKFKFSDSTVLNQKSQSMLNSTEKMPAPNSELTEFTRSVLDSLVIKNTNPTRLNSLVLKPRNIANLQSKDTQPSSKTSNIENPTIRVNIGRIEVRAVMSSMPSVTPVRKKTTPILTLDEYLKQRNGR